MTVDAPSSGPPLHPPFVKPRPGAGPTRHLFVANCGPASGVPLTTVRRIFGAFGRLAGVCVPAADKPHVYVSFAAGPAPAGYAADTGDDEQDAGGWEGDEDEDEDEEQRSAPAVAAAVAAAAALHGVPCAAAGGRVLIVRPAARLRQPAPPDERAAFIRAEELGIPGLHLLFDFVSREEEAALLAAADAAPDAAAADAAPPAGVEAAPSAAGPSDGVPAPAWQHLARRRVQHHGYVFDYSTRGVDPARPLGPLPAFCSGVLDRLTSTLAGLVPAVARPAAGAAPASASAGGAEASTRPPSAADEDDDSLSAHPLDQLTINEYGRGVGLAPHIDTHSAFIGPICSLSLAGPCVMELRRPPELMMGGGLSGVAQASPSPPAPPLPRRVLHLPPRSLLVLIGEARYAWQHYIPHRVADRVRGGARAADDDDAAGLSDAAGRAGGAGAAGGSGPAAVATRGGTAAAADAADAGVVMVPRAARRVSFTFRAVRRRSQPCTCPYPAVCDSQQALGAHTGPERATPAAAGSLAAATAPECPAGAPPLEASHVHAVYEVIAPHFGATRFARWPRVARFLASLPPGAIVADVGCGSGKYLSYGVDGSAAGAGAAGAAAVAAARAARRERGGGPDPAAATATMPPPQTPPNSAAVAAPATAGPLAMLGSDTSSGLLELCRRSGHSGALARADGLHLPYRAGSCDAALCIAVLHHLSSTQRRREMVAEMARVLRPGGRGLLTVWATQQESPAATLDKWRPIDLPPADEASGREDSEAAAPDARPGASMSSSWAGTASSSDPYPTAEVQEYFVPWHLPVHRVEGAAAARALKQAKARGGRGERGGRGAGGRGGRGADEEAALGAEAALEAAAPSPLLPEAPAPPPLAADADELEASPPATPARMDDVKHAVVFDRYYHLFSEHELPALVSEVPGVTVLPGADGECYDKSNWCCEFVRGG